jgi:two-component system response regulator HydG
LLAYDWPGNVRELENCIERAVAMARFDHLTVEDLPDAIRNHRSATFSLTADQTEEVLALAEVGRRYAARAVALMSGNKMRAAQRLGIDRRTLGRMLGDSEREPSAS